MFPTSLATVIDGQHRRQATPATKFPPLVLSLSWWSTTSCFLDMSFLSLGFRSHHRVIVSSKVSALLTNILKIWWHEAKDFLKATESQDPLVFHGHGFEATLGPVLASQLTFPMRKTEIQKGFSQNITLLCFYWNEIFSVLPHSVTWNAAFKTQGKDLIGNLRGISNTAHTLVLPLRPLPSCQRHHVPLLSCVTADKDFHVRSQ